MVTVYFLDVSLNGYTETEKQHMLEKTFPLLQTERRNKIAALRFLEDQLCSAGAGVLFDLGLRSYGLSASDVTVAKRVNQKPYLKDHPEIRFNLSHSGTMVMAAFSDHEIGCDIERIGKGNQKVVKRFFHPEEQAYLEQAALTVREEDWKREFCRYWTLKESVMKVTGEGVRLLLDEFCVRPGEEPEVFIKGEKMPYEIREFSVPGYCASICVEGEAGDVFFSFQNLQDVV